MTSVVERLTLKKLKIWSVQNPSQVLVVQDGSTPDGEATILGNDGFRNGVVTFGAANKHDRYIFTMESLEATREGKTLRFRVAAYVHTNDLSLGRGDRIQFSLAQGAQTGSVAWQTWHSGAQPATQTLHFDGFARSVRRERATGGRVEFIIEAVDALTWADEITVVQDLENEISIPTIYLGEHKRGDNDYFLAIKKLDAVPTYGFGNPRDPSLTMNVGEILTYLGNAYGADLESRKIKPIGVTLFFSAELALLTEVPPKMVFESQGFATVCRNVLRSMYPDWDLRVDPRTRRWHVVASGLDQYHSGFTTIGAQINDFEFTVIDDSLFATTGPGSSIRLVSATNIFQTEVVQVAAINFGTNTITTVDQLIYDWVLDDFAIPMYAASARPPVVAIDLELHSGSNTLDVDLSATYTAVRVVGREQKTERIKITQDPSGGLKINKNWFDDYAAAYRQGKHQFRRNDRGAAGNGIEIDEITTVGGFTQIYFSAEDSAHGDDHVVVGSGGVGEWQGCAVSFLSSNYANIEAGNFSAKITHFRESGWMDPPTNSLRRYRLDLDRDISLTIAVLKTKVAHGTGDLFELSSSDLHSPKNPNQRWKVGRTFHFENTEAVDEAQYLSDRKCPIVISTQLGDFAYQDTAQNVHRASGAPQTWQEVNDYWDLNPAANPLGGQARAWRLPKPPEKHPNAQAETPHCAVGFAIAKDFRVEVEVDKHTLDINSVRIPADGYAGSAWFQYRHARELIVVLDGYDHPSQDAQAAVIAQALWRRLSDAKYTGSIELEGIANWLPLADLGFRVTLGPGGTGFAGGVSTDQLRFWGLVESMVYDFTALRTSMAFDSRGFGDDLQIGLFERKFITESSEMKSIRTELERVKHEQECLRQNVDQRPPARTPGCTVALGPQSLDRYRSKTEVKEDGIQVGTTQLGAPNVIGGSTFWRTGSLAFQPAWLIERGYDGVAAAFAVPSGAVYHGTESGNQFIPDVGAAAQFVALPEFTAQGLEELGEAFLGISLETPLPNFLVEMTTGSTTTVLQLANPIPNDSRFVGGFVEFAEAGTEARPRYTIASHTGTTVTLTSAMAETVPTAGLRATVWTKRLPLLDATDFPSGGRAFKDTAGNWFVAHGGTITAANLVSGVLEEDTSSPATAQIEVGNAGVDVAALGDWTFGSVAAGVTPTATAHLATKGYVDGLTNKVPPWSLTVFFADVGVHDAGSGTLALTAPMLAAPTDRDGALRYYALANIVNAGNLVEFRVPDEVAVGSDIRASLIYRLSATPSDADAVDLFFDWRANANGEATESGGATGSLHSTPVLTGQATGTLYIKDLGVAFSSGTLSVGDFVHGAFSRNATVGNAPDVYSGDLQIVAIVFTGTGRLV